MNMILQRLYEITSFHKILEIGNLNIAFYIMMIIFVLTNSISFVMSFFVSALTTGFLKHFLHPFSPSGHMTMVTIIILWVAFLSKQPLYYPLSLILIFGFGYVLTVTNSHTVPETIMGFTISLISFLIFVLH